MNCCDRVDVRIVNETCQCRFVTRASVDQTLASGRPELAAALDARPGLFAATDVFIGHQTRADILGQVQALEAVLSSAPWTAHVADRNRDATIVAQPGPAGMLMGYDFHIAPDGPRLIEINTNAGGAFLMAEREGVEATGRLTEMVFDEWQRARRTASPRTLAIVDDAPEDQFLYPDMLIARDLLLAAGIDTVIANASDLTFDGKLRVDGRVIDMVYNRLTDFLLAEPRHGALRAALLSDAAVISPAPRHHASHADKRNLATLTDPDALSRLGIDPFPLAALPRVIQVKADDEDRLWATRRGLFFKPEAGFGGRGVYRGEKLTRGTFHRLMAGGYVAQDYVPPALRAIPAEDGAGPLKYDLRVYTYAGRTLLLAARLYQGQATNFRTPGGGLARVVAMQSS